MQVMNTKLDKCIGFTTLAVLKTW